MGRIPTTVCAPSGLQRTVQIPGVRINLRSSSVKKKLALVQLAKHREPRLLVTGQTVSQFGDGVALVALTLLVLDTTHSVSKLAWFAAARMAPLVIFLFGTFDAVFMPAMTALTPEIVPEELLPAMNAVRPLANNLMGSMIGPAVGGVIAAASTSWAIGVDCGTFLVSASALFLMKPTPSPRRTPGSSMLSEIKEGVRFVRRTRWLRANTLAAGI